MQEIISCTAFKKTTKGWVIEMDNQSIMSVRNITKTFPGVKALDNVSFEIKKGTVHAICGENGAGKSTLMKIISGVYKRDSGEIYFEGKPMKEDITPKESQELGISIIYQEFNLVDTLSIAENIYLGRLTEENKKLVDWKRVNKDAEELLASIGYTMDVKTLVRDLSVAQKQMIEISKALSQNAKLIIMDEPSATLTSKDLKTFFDVIRGLRDKGITVIYISHKLEEVFELCDEVTVFRDGTVIDTNPISSLTKDDIIAKMVGRSVDVEFPKRNTPIGEEVLRVENLCAGDKVRNISFNLKKGEILGLMGLVGAGRTETVRAIFGADKKDSGKIFLNGREIKINSPKDAIDNKMILLTEDRRGQGLFLNYSVSSNIVSANIKKTADGYFIVKGREEEAANEYVEELKIKTPSIMQKTVNLSGGNQQKVVVAKSLYSEPDILIMDEPTRGIDVGAKYEIYLIMNKLVEEGKSIIFISSETPEILGMSDRVVVLFEGQKTGEFSKEELKDTERVMQAAIGE